MRMACLVFFAAASGVAYAQPMAPNPDWPCQQRLIPTLFPGSYWTGPAVHGDDTSWHDDEKLSALVTNAVDRDTPDTEAVGSLTAYADALPADQRAVQIPRLFGFIVNETNDERGQVIGRIEALAQRQREVGDLISDASKQIDTIPETSIGPAAAHRAELVGQRDLNTQAFQETQHTMRYACEVPGTLERRLGLFARALQGKLGK